MSHVNAVKEIERLLNESTAAVEAARERVRESRSLVDAARRQTPIMQTCERPEDQTGAQSNCDADAGRSTSGASPEDP
jgi:hypothetical protein